MKIRINLVVFGINQIDGSYHVVSTAQDVLSLPSEVQDKCVPTLSILEKLVTQHIHLDINWVQPKLIHILSNPTDDIYEIIYQCIIPFDTKLINAYWLDLYKCNNNNILYEALQYL